MLEIKRNQLKYINSIFRKLKNIDQKISADYSKKFVLLYIGNTSKRRGLETVIDALPLLKDKIFNIKLVIIGQSSFDKKLRSKVKKLKLSNFVDFMGWKKENELYKYLMIAHLGISPLHRNIHHDTTYANKLFQYISFLRFLLKKTVLQ